MAVVLLNEAFGDQFFRDLRENGAFIGQGSSQVVDAVAAGETAACLVVDYMVFDKINSGEALTRAIELNNTDMSKWRDEIVGNFITIMQDN